MNALDICNACDAEVKTPNKFGYCDQCLKEMRAANMTTNSKPTKGPDVYGVLTAAERGMQFFRDGGTRQHYIESLQRTRPFVEEAQDVYRSTGLTPRELKEQRDQLLKIVKAIAARMDGEFDNPALMSMGPLTHDIDADIKNFIQAAGAAAEKGKSNDK